MPWAAQYKAKFGTSPFDALQLQVLEGHFLLVFLVVCEAGIGCPSEKQLRTWYFLKTALERMEGARLRVRNFLDPIWLRSQCSDDAESLRLRATREQLYGGSKARQIARNEERASGE